MPEQSAPRDPLTEALLRMKSSGSKPRVITTYTDADIGRMVQVLASARLIPGIAAGSDEIRCPCPFHENHGSPTLWINMGKVPDMPHGSFTCFSCGESGHWPKLERKLTGASTIGSVSSYEESEIVEILTPKRGKDLYIKPAFLMDLEDGFTWDHPDGAFEKDFLDTLGAKLAIRVWYDKTVKQQFSELRLWLPVYMRYDLVGDILAALERPAPDAEEFIRKSFKKYINSESLESKETLWPLPYVVSRFGNQRVVLVEGPADAMRLLNYGIPALAILGTGVWSERKADIVYYAFNEVATCFDGDAAGKSVTERATQSLKGRLGDALKQIQLPPGCDPGKFRPADGAWLRSKLGIL